MCCSKVDSKGLFILGQESEQNCSRELLTLVRKLGALTERS